MADILQNPSQNETIIRHTRRLLHSYQHWTGESLFDLTAREHLNERKNTPVILWLASPEGCEA
jgi:hypothetical protein